MVNWNRRDPEDDNSFVVCVCALGLFVVSGQGFDEGATPSYQCLLICWIRTSPREARA